MRTVATLGAGLLGLALSAPLAERPVSFRVGETLTYDVAWSSYVTAGTAVSTIAGKQPVAGSPAYHIVAEGRPIALVSKLYKLGYRIDTLLDATTLLPRRASVSIEEGARKRTQPTVFDRTKNPGALDPLSALYVLRASPLKPGARVTMAVVDNDTTYTVRCDVGAPETVVRASGNVPAWRIAVTAADAAGRSAVRDMAVWISTDAKRLPVKLKAALPIGEFTLVLRGTP